MTFRPYWDPSIACASWRLVLPHSCGPTHTNLCGSFHLCLALLLGCLYSETLSRGTLLLGPWASSFPMNTSL